MKRLFLGGVLLVGMLMAVWLWTAKPSTVNNRAEVPAATPTAGVNFSGEDWIQGKPDAPVKIIEYGDFQCPSCAAYYPVMEELKKTYGDRMAFVYRHYPLTRIHTNAMTAAMGAEAAGRQGKFWQMYAELFRRQAEWSSSTNFRNQLNEYAASLGLSIETFNRDMEDGRLTEKIQEHMKLGDSIGVKGTPTFVVNGEKIALPGSLEQFKVIIDGELAKHNQVTTIHEHADMVVFVDGKKFDFSTPRFQTANPAAKPVEENEYWHFHDGNGEMVHKHRTGYSLGKFFEQWKLVFPDNGQLYVNGELAKSNWRDYEIRDLDRLVLVFGRFEPKMLLAVKDEACIYSESCPERGRPPTEGCVGGVGTDCQ